MSGFAVAGNDVLPEGGYYQGFCYHDVKDRVYGNYDPDAMAVSTQELFNLFSWIRDHDFHPLSVDEILAAERGEAPLPKNGVLLSFDDGLISSYSVIYPMLKLFNYPAVIAPVVSWVENPKKHIVKYGNQVLDKEGFMTWEQIKEISDHGLVEIGSHSYNLHKGIRGNPQGNSQPAAVTRKYDPATGLYETDEQYYKRIYNDLKMSADIIEEKTGKRPRTMVWPYGRYNETTIGISKKVGMPVTLVLDEALNTLGDSERIGRHLVSKNPPMDIFTWALRNPGWNFPDRSILIDIDQLYDKDPAVMKARFDDLLDRISEMQVSYIILKAFSDEDNDGVADAVYFPNRHMPMKADLFNRVAWQLKIRSGADCLAWMPLLAFNLPEEKGAVYVARAGLENGGDRRRRLSPFHDHTRNLISEIYEDLGKHAAIAGVLFRDDAFLRADEDASKPALEFYQSHWDLPPDIAAIQADPNLALKWTKLKTHFLMELTQELKVVVDRWRAPLVFARTIDTGALMDPDRERDTAKSYEAFLKEYDFVFVDAQPHQKRTRHKYKWLKELTDQARAFDPKFNKTLFQLHTMEGGKPIPARVLVDRMDYLVLQGALNYGYGPDLFTVDKPDTGIIRLGISLKEFPYK